MSVPTLYMLERRPYKTGGVAGVWVSLYQCGDPVVCQTSRVRISGPRVPVVRTLFPATLLLCQPITAPILNPTVECVQETSIGPKILECRLECSHLFSFSIVCTVLSYQMFVMRTSAVNE